MKPELTRRLLGTYPRLYSLSACGPRRSNMCFGFECGDGWYRLLDNLSRWMTRLWKLLRIDVKASQVKEKLGGLRFYVHPRTPRWMPRRLARLVGTLVYWLIDRAANEAWKTCENCGKPGVVMHRHYWYITSCAACAPEGYEPCRQAL